MYSISQHTTPIEYKVQIAMNSCYDMLFDGTKNRVYFTIHGFWKNRESVSEFLSDWSKAVGLTRPGFSVLIDLRTMITHPQELNSLHQEAHTLVMKAGVKKVANVMPFDKIAYLQIQSLEEGTNLPTKNFNTFEEAEQWLDMMTTTSSN